jgi:D-inositol-3-phosphate glycosyltransferase
MTRGTEIRDQRSAVRERRLEGSHQASTVNSQPSITPSPQTLSPSSRPSLTKADQPSTNCNVALLTGGGDKPYALGLAAALTSAQVSLDFIGSDDLNVPELRDNARVNFLNLRGDQSPKASPATKIARVLAYYWRLIRYAATAQPKLFHILWNNKFEVFDRTLLLFYYKMLGKRLVFTAHNVNARKRDGDDSFLNRLSLRMQYRLSDHIFVHTDSMKRELVSDFSIQERKVSVIPFGINNTVPNTALTTLQAKQRLGVSRADKTILFFGNIAPYKGVEYLVSAFVELLKKDGSYRLIFAGKPKGCDDYWKQIQQAITRSGARDRFIERIEYVPDEETELYFKAADVLALPYTRIFQSGVLFLGYSFGLPVIVADIGPLKEQVIEGKTGFVFKPQDSSDLAGMISKYFESDLFHNLESHRQEIKQYANERYSWNKVVAATIEVYSQLLPNWHSVPRPSRF